MEYSDYPIRTKSVDSTDDVLFEYVKQYMQKSEDQINKINAKESGEHSDRAINVCFVISLVLLIAFYVFGGIRMYTLNKRAPSVQEIQLMGPVQVQQEGTIENGLLE